MDLMIIGSGYTIGVTTLTAGYELMAATSFVPHPELMQTIDGYLAAIGARRTTPWKQAPADEHVWRTTTGPLSIEDFARAAGVHRPTDDGGMLRERRKYWQSVLDRPDT